MIDSKSVFELSLSELAYLLVFILAIIFVFNVNMLSNRNSELIEETTILTRRIDSLETNTNRGLGKPPCLNDGYLFETAILSSGLYKLEDTIVTYDGLLIQYADAILESIDHDCAYRIIAYYTPLISTDTYIQEVRRLRQYFHVREEDYKVSQF